MNLISKALLLAAPLLQTPIRDQPRAQLSILVLNGVEGKPIPKARLLVFAGATPHDVEDHRHSFDLHTDSHGVAMIPPGQMWPASLNIFVDFMTQCELHPNSRSFSLPEAMERGLVAGNSCGVVKLQPTPGQLVIFARRPTLRERMAW